MGSPTTPATGDTPEEAVRTDPASSAAARFWAIPDLRRQAYEEMDTDGREICKTLDKASFGAYVRAVYRSVHIDEYWRLDFRRVSQVSLSSAPC
jgi:hypothetical protein